LTVLDLLKIGTVVEDVPDFGARYITRREKGRC
jgi:hypothetical protein